MKTRDSLHILTNHHEPQCKVAEIKGKYVDPEEVLCFTSIYSSAI